LVIAGEMGDVCELIELEVMAGRRDSYSLKRAWSEVGGEIAQGLA
jgi:hypothetical protein